MICKNLGILLLCLVKSTLCIPLDQFYPIGADATEPSSLLGDGDDASSRKIFTQQVYQFFGQPRDSVIVRLYVLCFSVHTLYMHYTLTLGQAKLIHSILSGIFENHM